MWRGVGRVYLHTNNTAGYVAAADAAATDVDALSGAAQDLLTRQTSTGEPGVHFEYSAQSWSYIMNVAESEVDSRQPVSDIVDLIIGEVALA